MFYCDPCAEKNGWHRTPFKSRGRCEMCGEPAVCNDTPSSLLPPARDVTTTPAPRPVVPRLRPVDKEPVEISSTLGLLLFQVADMDMRLEEIEEARTDLRTLLNDAAHDYHAEQLAQEVSLGLVTGAMSSVGCCQGAFEYDSQQGNALVFRTACAMDHDVIGVPALYVPIAWLNDHLTRPADRTA